MLTETSGITATNDEEPSSILTAAATCSTASLLGSSCGPNLTTHIEHCARVGYSFRWAAQRAPLPRASDQSEYRVLTA
jgi:hypothetical protein